MNTSDFTSAILTSFAILRQVTKVDLHTDGAIVKGRAFLNGEIFLAFYYNQITMTQSFALIKDTERIWGIDFEVIHGWHLHPLGKPDNHLAIQAQEISSIVEMLKGVLDILTSK